MVAFPWGSADLERGMGKSWNYRIRETQKDRTWQWGRERFQCQILWAATTRSTWLNKPCKSSRVHSQPIHSSSFLGRRCNFSWDNSPRASLALSWYDALWTWSKELGSADFTFMPEQGWQAETGAREGRRMGVSWIFTPPILLGAPPDPAHIHQQLSSMNSQFAGS